MKTLAVLIASLSLTGCIATVGVVVPVEQPVYVRPAPVYVTPAPVYVYPRHHYYHRGHGHHKHHRHH